MFQAKESEWARRTGPDAGENGQLLHLTTTQHVSRREGRGIWNCGKCWRREGLPPNVSCAWPRSLLLLSLFRLTLQSDLTLPSEGWSKKANLPIHDSLLLPNPSTGWACFQEKGTGSLTVAHGALGAQPHLPSISSLSFRLLSLQEPSLYPARDWLPCRTGHCSWPSSPPGPSWRRARGCFALPATPLVICAPLSTAGLDCDSQKRPPCCGEESLSLGVGSWTDFYLSLCCLSLNCVHQEHSSPFVCASHSLLSLWGRKHLFAFSSLPPNTHNFRKKIFFTLQGKTHCYWCFPPLEWFLGFPFLLPAQHTWPVETQRSQQHWSISSKPLIGSSTQFHKMGVVWGVRISRSKNKATGSWPLSRTAD